MVGTIAADIMVTCVVGFERKYAAVCLIRLLKFDAIGIVIIDL